MNYFYFLTLPSKVADLETLCYYAQQEFGSTGIQEYSMDEPEVDELLGARSYSGGDLPPSVLQEVDAHHDQTSFKVFFKTQAEANAYCSFVKENFKLDLKIEQAEQEDWNESWKQSFMPIAVNEQLEIVPSWMEDYKSTSTKQLYIYPGMGFGTGNHETTFLCLQLMFETRLENLKSVLDFGCGSGILGLAVGVFNRQAKIDLYDIEKEAIENSAQNESLNSNPNVSYFLPQNFSELGESYDLVFANILKNTLLEEAEDILSRVKKDLIISGLLKGEEREVIATYTKQRPELKERKVLTKGDWSAVHLSL